MEARHAGFHCPSAGLRRIRVSQHGASLHGVRRRRVAFFLRLRFTMAASRTEAARLGNVTLQIVRD